VSALFVRLLLVLALLAVSFAAGAQQLERRARVGFLAPGTPAYWDGSVQIFRLRLRELGWIEGRNLMLDVRYANDNYERLPGLAAELVALKPDVIAAGASSATLAAGRATSTIPIVFETIGDAVAQGLVSNLARPERNLTGLSGFSPELAAKRLALIRQIVPDASRIGLVANLDNVGTRSVVQSMETAAQHLGVALELFGVRAPDQLEPAFKEMARRRAGAFLLAADPMLFAQNQRIVEMAARYRLPGAYELRLFADRGGLLSYGPRGNERFEQMAVYVDRILRGAKPADLPVEQPIKFELVINLRTVQQLGLTIPQSLLLQADEVIK